MSKLTPQQRLARIVRNKNIPTWDEIDLELSREITFVERELKFPIYGDYPLLKFLRQLEDINYFNQKEANQLPKTPK